MSIEVRSPVPAALSSSVQRDSVAPSVDSWLLPVIASTFPIVQLARTVIDRPSTVMDVTGTVHFVTEGSGGQLVQLLMVGVMSALAVQVVIHAARHGGLHLSPWVMLAGLLPFMMVLRSAPDVIELGYAIVTVLVVVALGARPVTARSIARVGLVAGATAVSLVVFGFFDPTRGWLECRPDKCSPAGSLLVGYFPQENVVGIFLAGLTPAIAFIRGPLLRRACLLLVLAAIVLTGSRTSMLAAPFGLLAYAIVRRRGELSPPRGDASKVLGLMAVVTFVASLIMVFVIDEAALTGRGIIYRIIREAWLASPVIGPGREALAEAYFSGSVNWYVAHEHSEGAYILAQAGVLGAALLLVGMLSIAVACWRSRGPVPAIFSLVPALGFLTEPTWEVSVRGAGFASLALTIALVATAISRSDLPQAEVQPSARRVDRLHTPSSSADVSKVGGTVKSSEFRLPAGQTRGKGH